jgi:hypothetical protein
MVTIDPASSVTAMVTTGSAPSVTAMVPAGPAPKISDLLARDAGSEQTAIAARIRALSSASLYYALDLKGKAPALDSHDASRAKLVVQCFTAVATNQHKVSLRGSELDVTKTTNEMEDLIIARMLLAYTEANVDPPPCLKTYKKLTVNSISDRIKEMKTKLKDTPANWKTMMILPLTPEERAKLPTKPTTTTKKRSRAS